MNASTVDVVAFQGILPGVELTQGLSIDGSGGALCFGLRKLIQRWVLEFLTELGSISYWRTRGSAFVTDLRRGAIQTETDVFQSFSLASVAVAASLRGEEDANDPPEERYGSCRLLVVIISSGQLDLSVGIRSLAGAAARFSIPVRIRN